MWQKAPGTLVDPHGHPRFGTFDGALPPLSWKRLRGPYALSPPERLARRRRRELMFVASSQFLGCVTLGGWGFATAASLVAVEVATRRSLVAASAWWPSRLGPYTRFRAPELQLTLGTSSEEGAPFELSARRRRPGWGDTSLSATFEPSGTARSAIAPLPDGGVAAAFESTLYAGGEGTVRGAGKSLSLAGSRALHLLTEGMFGMEVTSRSASGLGRLADGRPLSWSLFEGMTLENAPGSPSHLRVGDEARVLEQVFVRRGAADPLERWSVEASGQGVRLALTHRPWLAHRELDELRLWHRPRTLVLGEIEGSLELDGDREPIGALGVIEADDSLR